MTNEIHPVVELLIARMESHPEEFKDDYMMSEVRPTAGSGRWLLATQAIQDHGSKRDVEALNVALSKIYMQRIHEWTMDELLNGEDRRREEEERKKQLWTQQQQAHAQMAQVNTGLQNANQLSSYQQSALSNIYNQQSAMLGAASPPPQPQLGEDSLMQQIRKRLIK
jgi:hypothetical protein